jgi:hypothetical protein
MMVRALALGAAALAVPAQGADRQTVCVGRVHMDLPAEFAQIEPITMTLTPEQSDREEAAMEVEVHMKPLNADEFKQKVAQRQAKPSEGSASVKMIRAEAQRIVFRTVEGKDYFTNEMHLLKNGVYLVSKIVTASDQFKRGDAYHADLIRNLEPWSAAAKPGAYCLGPLLVRGKYAREYADWRFVSKKFSDLSFGVHLDSIPAAHNTSMLDIMGAMGGMVKTNVLRKGSVKLAGMPAQEYLSTMMRGERKQFSFLGTTLPRETTATMPIIQLSMGSSHRQPEAGENFSALSDAQAVALWDAVMPTLRLAPQ